MNNSMPSSMHKRQDSMISLGGGSTSGDDFFASVAGFEDFGNGEDDLDLMDGEDESKDSLGDLQQDGSGGPAKKLKRPPSTAEKKATHNAVERARRESLNGRFLVLADMLPGMNHVKRASKAAIVNKSIDLINDLRATEIQLNKENSALKSELEALRSRVGSGANNGATASATGPLTPGMPLPLPAGMQGPAAAHAAAAAAAAMIAAGHHPHTHPALAGLTGQLPPPLAFQQQLQQQMQQDGGAGMMSSLNGQQQPPLTPNGPLSAQQMHEHAAAMTMAAHQHQFLQQQHHLAQQQAHAQAQAQAQVQAQQQQQMQAHQQQQMQQHMFPGVFNGFFNGVGLLDTLESARSESGSPTSVHSSAQQQAILGTSPSSSHFAYNAAAGIPQLPTPAPLANAAAAAAYFNEAALTTSSTSPPSSETNNNNINSNNSLHTLLGNAASANTPPASHYSPISFHSPSSSSTFAQQRLGSRGTASGSSGNEGTAPSPASSHSVPTPPNAIYSPPSSTTSAVLKKDSDPVQAAVAAVQPALASPLLPNTFEDANAKAQADLQQYFAYQQRLASLNSAQAAQAQAAAAAAAMGFLPSHAAAALAQAQQQQQGAGNTSPNSATFGANGQGMNIPVWQLMMAQHQALSTYGGVTGPTHF